MRQSFVVLAALAVLGVAEGASAKTGWSWTPPNSPFSGSGSMSWTINGQSAINCNVAMTAQTAATGRLQVTGLTFTDNGDGTCSDVTAPLDSHPEFWNPTSANYSRWGDAKFHLPPTGVQCFGNIGMKVTSTGGGDTMVSIDANIASRAGACHVNGQIDIGNVGIVQTPIN